jgi:hypothetical protein
MTDAVNRLNSALSRRIERQLDEGGMAGYPNKELLLHG